MIAGVDPWNLIWVMPAKGRLNKRAMEPPRWSGRLFVLLAEPEFVQEVVMRVIIFANGEFANGADPAAFDALDGVSDVTAQDGTVRFRVTGELDPVIKLAARYHVIDLHYEEPSLGEIFLEYYGGGTA